jgi:replicative DNA helicase
MDAAALNLEEDERMYLGGLLEAERRGDLDRKLRETPPLESGDFYKPEYGRIYSLILKQHRAGITVDLVTLAKDYPDIRFNANIATPPEGSVGGYYNLALYAGHIAGESRRRNLIRHLRQATEDLEKGAEAEAVTGDLLPVLEKSPEKERQRLASWEDYLNDLKSYDPEQDFSTSLFDGLRCPNGSINIIAARPAGGKTSAMINATREALDTSRAAFFVNLEMNRRQIITDLCLSLMYALADGEVRAELEKTGATIIAFNRAFRDRLRGKPENGAFGLLQTKAMERVRKALDEKRLFIYDGIGESLEAIRSDIRTHVKPGDVVLLDYIQRVPPPLENQAQTRQVQIQEASRSLLNTAIGSQCVIIAGAQLGREVQKNGGREATQADLRESGDIENDAHNVIAIETKNGNPAYIHPLKAREGGALWDRLAIKAVKQYVYWTAEKEYKAESKFNSAAGQESADGINKRNRDFSKA